MAIDRGSDTTTQLLTLLNVSATRSGKRKWNPEDSKPGEKLNKRRAVQFDEPSTSGTTLEVDANEGETGEVGEEKGKEHVQTEASATTIEKGAEEVEETGEDDEEGAFISIAPFCLENSDSADLTTDPYEAHFAANTKLVTENRRTIADSKTWKLTKCKHGRLGNVVEYNADEGKDGGEAKEDRIAVCAFASSV